MSPGRAPALIAEDRDIDAAQALEPWTILLDGSDGFAANPGSVFAKGDQSPRTQVKEQP